MVVADRPCDAIHHAIYIITTTSLSLLTVDQSIKKKERLTAMKNHGPVISQQHNDSCVTQYIN